jgi:hypothetical protein
MVFLQQVPVFFLERLCTVMFLLVLDVVHQILQLAPTDGEIPIACLPKEGSVLFTLALDPADEVFLIFSRRSAWLMVRASRAAIWTWSLAPPTR